MNVAGRRKRHSQQQQQQHQQQQQQHQQQQQQQKPRNLNKREIRELWKQNKKAAAKVRN